jgi:hypothetical protein
MKKMIPISVVLALFTFTLHSQNYSIGWFKVAGGGGAGAGGQYSVNGTTGQHDAGVSATNGHYSITGGFWSLFTVPTPGAPLLKIFLTTTNTAVILWPSPSSGWNLQQNSKLSTTNWVGPSEIANDDGTNKFIIVNPPAGNRYYRLSKP